MGQMLSYDKKTRKNSEKLLESWLRLSSTVWNERIVTKITFNEAFILNLLTRSKDSITATDLCSMTGILKSQMNKILREMEEKGFIARERSESDRRAIIITPLPEGKRAYSESHEATMRVMDDLVTFLGEEKTLETASVINSAADALKSILKNYSDAIK